MKRACIIFNPTAKGEKAQRLRRHLEGFRRECALKPTLAAGAARVLATEAVREGCDTIIAAGGDGTVNEVINGIADEPGGLTQARFGVLPLGTVNVFARELGLSFDLAKAWETICAGRERLIDLPEIEFQAGGRAERRCFVQMAGCGLDAQAVACVDWELKKKIGQFAYVVAGFKVLRRPRSAITVTDGTRSLTGPLALLGNGRLYAGSIPVFQEADLTDGLIDVCVFPAINWFVVLRYACAFLSPRFLLRGREQHVQTRAVRLESSSPVPLELDGEHVGEAPAACSVRRSVLRVLAS